MLIEFWIYISKCCVGQLPTEQESLTTEVLLSCTTMMNNMNSRIKERKQEKIKTEIYVIQ